MIKLSTKQLFILFLISSIIFGLLFTRDMNRYNSNEGNLFFQFEATFGSLLGALLTMYFYVQALKKKDKNKKIE